MADLGDLALYVGSSAAINAVSKVSKREDPVPGLIASGILFGLFAIIGSLWRFDVVKAIAAVMLLAAILTNGVKFIQSLSSIASLAQSGVRTAVPVNPSKGGTNGSGSSGSGGGGGGGGGV